MSKLNEFLSSKSQFLMIAGPCAIESHEQIASFLELAKDQMVLRAGVYKMRTNATSFQGLGNEAIEIIRNLKQVKPFDFVTEVTDPRQIESLHPVIDMYQVGARNMYNYDLLKELNKTGKPVLLKRAFSATVSEWLNACGYMQDLGEDKIVLCERGIRTFETTTRNTLDINSVIYLKQNHPFKVIVDPSHGSGIKSMVAPLCKVALVSGADGILVESHPTPEMALSDKHQQITPSELNDIRSELTKIASLVGREIL